MTRKPFRLAAAAVSALAITSVCAAPMAFADVNDQTKVDGVSQAAANPVLVNGDATVQLNIHKHLGAPTGQPNNGTVQTVNRPALQGVVFDIWRVDGIDLTTNAGWDAAAAAEGVTPTFLADGTGPVVINGTTYNLVKETSVTTGASGTATFTKVDGVGLYFVKENLAASGTITDLSTNAPVDAASITPSAPFFVTLPMTNPDDLDSWMYDVRVYPKNQSDSITKTVDDDETYTVGEEISYGFVSTISAVEDLKYYYIGDNNAYVDFTSVTVALSNGTALTGYTVDSPAGTYDYYYVLYGGGDPANGNHQLSIVFTQDGLDKLEAAKAADASVTVVTTINGTVSSVPEDGQVPNQGSFIPNGDWWSNNGGGELPPLPPTDGPNPEEPVEVPETPGIPSNPVVSYFGNIKVNKSLVNAAAGDTAVGATFAVYVDPTPTTACTADDVTGTPLMEEAITEGNTVVFSPLRASNWAFNAELANSSANGWIQYCVVETKAPEGYNLNAEPFTATIDWKTGTSTVTRTAEVNISNEKSNLGNELPLTGGEGVAALSIGGLALIGGGAAYYAVASRKRREA